MLSLGRFVDAVIVEPAPPVIDDVAALTRHRLGGLRVALERHADGIDRRDHLPFGEDAHETPEADTTAVFVGQLHIKIARALEWGGYEKVGQARLGDLVAVQHAALATLLIVDDEIDGEARPAGPTRVQRLAGIADGIARIAGHRRQAAVMPMSLSRVAIVILPSIARNQPAVPGRATHWDDGPEPGSGLRNMVGGRLRLNWPQYRGLLRSVVRQRGVRGQTASVPFPRYSTARSVFGDLGEQPDLDRAGGPLLLRVVVGKAAGLEDDGAQFGDAGATRVVKMHKRKAGPGHRILQERDRRRLRQTMLAAQMEKSADKAMAAVSVIVTAARPVAVVGKMLKHQVEQLHRLCDFGFRHWFERSRSG